MTVDTSRSCLGLGTCVGSAIRQIVHARVLLTATAPPALPGGRMLGGSLAPPLAAIIGLVQSVCRHRHLPGDGPHEARQFAGDRGGDDVLTSTTISGRTQWTPANGGPVDASLP